jgi:hypothetical protein
VTTYVTKIALPDLLRSFVQKVQEVGGVIGIDADHLLIELEADDRYDLGTTVRELQQELTAIICEAVQIDKPTPKGECSD